LKPYSYLRDVLDRPATLPASRISELLPHLWSATSDRSSTIARLTSGPVAKGRRESPDETRSEDEALHGASQALSGNQWVFLLFLEPAERRIFFNFVSIVLGRIIELHVLSGEGAVLKKDGVDVLAV